MAEPTDFANVKLLLLGNGSDGSTSVVDSSSTGRTVSVYGNAKISAIWTAFGSGALKFDNAGDYMTVPHSADFDFGSGDFTIDFWLYRDEFSAGANRRMIGKRASAGTGPFSIMVDSNGFLVATLRDTGGTVYTISSGDVEPFPIFVNEETAYFVTLDRSGSTVRLYLNGAVVGTATISGALQTNTEPVCIGHDIAASASASSQCAMAHLDDVRIIKGEALYAGAFTPPTSEAGSGGAAGATLSAAGPLGAPRLLALPGRFAQARAAGPLGAARVFGEHDFTDTLEAAGAVEFYVCDLVDAGEVTRVPISSWHGTLRVDGSSYLQAVVPAVADLAATIGSLSDEAEFVISRGARMPDGAEILNEMARSRIDEVQLDRGPQRFTCTLSGYSAAIAAPAGDGPPVRVLRGVRSVSTSSSSLRARCSIDWFLRPGYLSIADGTPITADYISFYVGGGDAYMDVGEQA